MRGILIADAGSTKTAWALCKESGEEVMRFMTDGLNAITAHDEDFRNLGDQLAANIPDGFDNAAVYYYGAGCATPSICDNMASNLAAISGTRRVTVESDLLGAARSLCGRKPGIACILGTGSNSCLYNGEKIIGHTPSLGYILGDEGGGVSLGRRLISDAFKGVMPDKVRKLFLVETGLDEATVLENVYRKGSPNRFLASFVPFISNHLDEKYLQLLVADEFRTFISRNIAAYPDSVKLPVSFTGGVAATFSGILRNVLSECGLLPGIICARPLDGLITYHSTSES